MGGRQVVHGFTSNSVPLNFNSACGTKYNNECLTKSISADKNIKAKTFLIVTMSQKAICLEIMKSVYCKTFGHQNWEEIEA